MNQYTNNHVHTIYSFSPYSPAQAVEKAKQSGLSMVGLMDHDSIAGAKEFIEAGKHHGIAVTVGMETRTGMDGTAFEGRRLNNPDQDSVAYVALHGVPHTRIKTLDEYFAPYRASREERNRLMTERLSAITSPLGYPLDYDRDVRPLSMADKGGSVTERHILYALALMLTKSDNPAGELRRLGCPLTENQKLLISNPENDIASYDILNVLKANFVDRFYIPASDECPPLLELAAFCRDNGIIFAYAYLGDVAASVTGDKKPQAFEDGFLDELIEALPGLGFNALTYMPARNTDAQIKRIQALCRKHGLFEICGEDINQPRQSFICEKLKEARFAHLEDAAWALAGHELRAGEDLSRGLFSAESIAARPDLDKRVKAFAQDARENFDSRDK